MRFQFKSICVAALALGAFAYPADIVDDEVADGPIGYAAENGGTTGGKGGETVTVKTFDELTKAVKGDAPKIVIVEGQIKQDAKLRVGSNTSLLGKDSTSELTGVGIMIKQAKNVIVRNLKINKVLADNGDAIGIQVANNVWIDHCDLSSDMTHDKDFYDGLLDITHAGDFVTVSYVHFHDHFKASLVGHSDNNEKEDKGHLRVTYHNNYWSNINSRAPSLRFGTGHVFNSLFENVKDGINTRQGAQVLVQNNVFINSSKPLYSTDGGFAIDNGNDFGTSKKGNAAPKGAITAPYQVKLLELDEVRSLKTKTGNILTL